MNVTLAIGATLFLGAFYSWTNRINGMFFFGRSADMEMRASAEGRAITRQYLMAVIATTVIAVAAAWFTSRLGRNFALAGPLGEAVAFWAIFARANRRVRALEMTYGTAAVHERVVQVPLFETPSYSVPSVGMALLPAGLAIVAFVTALLISAHGTGLRAGWDAWNASVEAHHLDLIFGMSVGSLSAATALLLLFRVSVRLRTNMAQYTIRTSVVMEWVGLALLLAVLGCNYQGFTPTHGASKALVIVGVVAVFALLVWNQARAKRFVPPPVEMGTDDRWRWGLFYADRNDPALFVQSRCGAGYTLNYGRMLAWPISLALVAYFVVLLFLPTHL